MTEKQCCVKVYPPDRFGGSYPCSRKAKVEHEGQWYCTQHSPAATEARRQKNREKWEAENAELNEKSRHINACIVACSGIPTEQLEAGVIAEMREALRRSQEVLMRVKTAYGDKPGFASDVGLNALNYAIEDSRAILTKLEGTGQ